MLAAKSNLLFTSSKEFNSQPITVSTATGRLILPISRQNLVISTNLEFSKWGNIYTDSQMTATMIDRIVHHGYLLIFEGRSYRVEHALMREETVGIAPKTKVIS